MCREGTRQISEEIKTSKTEPDTTGEKKKGKDRLTFAGADGKVMLVQAFARGGNGCEHDDGGRQNASGTHDFSVF